MSDGDAVNEANDWWLLWLGIPDVGKEDSLSPLVMYLLALELDFKSDGWLGAEPGDPLLLDLPPSATYWHSDPEFPRRMRESCARAAARIRAGHTMQVSTCTADEINVTIALNELRGAGVESFDHDPVVAELARREPGIDDLASLVDSTFELIGEDHDAVLLWDRSLDGIESDEVVVSLLGYGNLHPRDWFERFDSIDE